MVRVIFAFIFAPLSTPAALIVVLGVFRLLKIYLFADDKYDSFFAVVWRFILPATALAYVVTLILAIPTFLYLRRRKLLSLRLVLISGACLGGLPFVVWDSGFRRHLGCRHSV